MAATSLANEVIAARTARGMKRDALARASGIAKRTLRDIEQADPDRTYRPETLGKLDGPLGWDRGHAYNLWRPPEVDLRGEIVELRALIDQHQTQIGRLLAELLERPVWAAELVDACRLLSPEDRARVLDYARRLSR